MRISKIQFKNFGPYKGTFSMEFQKNPKKKIELITGVNGAGKTSVFNAIQWCLYGYEPSPTDPKPKQATKYDAWSNLYGTNKEGKIPSDPNMYVNLWLEEDNESEHYEYIIQRSIKPRNNVDEISEPNHIEMELSVSENGRLIENPIEKIDSLIPVSASQFFMFHGENLRTMSQKHLEHTKKAIELILEAELFRQGLDDLHKVRREIGLEFDAELKEVDSLKGVIISRDKKQQELTDEKDKLDKLKKDLAETERLLKDLELQLISYDSTKGLIEKIDEDKRKLEQINDDIKKLLVRRDGLINQLPSLVVLPELIKIMSNKEDVHKSNEKFKNQYNEIKGKVELIEQITKLEKCFCGNQITSVEKRLLNDQEQEFLAKLKEIEMGIIDQDPNYYAIKDIVTSINSINLDFDTYDRDLSGYNLRKNEVESDIKRVEKLLSGINREEIMKLTIIRNNTLTKIGELRQKVDNKREDVGDLEKIIDRFNRLINQRERSKSFSSSLSDQFDLSDRIINSYNYILDDLIDVRKDLLEKYTTEYFKKLTNNPTEYHKIIIDESYNLSIIDSTGSQRLREKLSTGERGVVALSFILGLKSASERNAPLILDTFFSHLDESHYSNIVKEFPSFAEQIILILTDLEYKTLKDRAPEFFFNAINNVWMVKRIKPEERSEISVFGGD